MKILCVRGPTFAGKTTALRRRTLCGAVVVPLRISDMDNPFPATVCDDGTALLGKYIHHTTGYETTADALPTRKIREALRRCSSLPGVRRILLEGDALSVYVGNLVLPAFPVDMVWGYLDTPLPILRDRASGFKFAHRDLTDEELAANWARVQATRTKVEAEGRRTITIPWETADERIQQWIEEPDA